MKQHFRSLYASPYACMMQATPYAGQTYARSKILASITPGLTRSDAYQVAPPPVPRSHVVLRLELIPRLVQRGKHRPGNHAHLGRGVLRNLSLSSQQSHPIINRAQHQEQTNSPYPDGSSQ